MKQRRALRVGDKVEILHYRTAVSWGSGKPQRYGFVENINGAYILVRPRWKREQIIELYPNEIRLVTS